MAANPAGVARTGLVAIADQFLTVSQAAAPCAFTLSASSQSYGFSAGTGQVSVTTLAGCLWSVVNTNSWITLGSATNNTNSGTVSYTVSANLVPSSRTGLVIIADQFLSVIQNGVTNGFSLTLTVTRVPTGAEVKLRFSGGPGGVWRLQGSSDLLHWQTIANITNSTGRVEFTDTVPANSDRRFYRTVQP